MKHDINTDTPLIPYIIAERAVWNVMEQDKKFNDAAPAEMAAIAENIAPELVSKAERIYRVNQHFRRVLKDKRKDPRYMLEMYMEHWTLSLINKITTPCTLKD